MQIQVTFTRSVGNTEVSEVAQSQLSSRRSIRNTGQTVLDTLDVSTTSATSVPSSAGGALKEQELQRRILAMESKLKDVDLLIKDQMPQQKSEAAPAFEEMQQELDEMQRYRESLEARAENLEKILLKERKEHQASLEAYSNSMNKSIDAMNNSVEKSVADSTALMKARMVEAENLIRKLVGQLNYAYSKPSNHEGQPSVAGMEGQQLVSSMTQLLEEHQQLVAANQNLMAWRTDFAGVGIPTWEAITLPQNYVEPPMLLSKVDVGARSPRNRSPEGSPTGCRSPGGQLGRSPSEQLGPSPSGCRSPGAQLGRSPSGQLGPSPSGQCRALLDTRPIMSSSAQQLEKMCVCGKMVMPIKKTKHLVNMDHPSGNWLLFVTGNGITWVRDGKSEADAASASGDVSSKSDKDFKLRHAVDIGMLAEAPLCPADHAETSLSDFLQSKDRLQLRTEVLNRVVDAETFPSEAPSRPQIFKDCKKEQAALVFHPDAAAAMAFAGKLTGADVPPEEAFHPKRPEGEMLRVVQDNADILHDMQSGAMSVEDPQGAEALRHLDLVKFKEVLKGKFLEGPGSNQSAWEALNRSMVDLDTAKAKNREYEEARRAYKQFLTPPPGNPSIWGENLQQLIEAGFFCPLTGFRKPSPELDKSNAIGEYVKAKHMIAELRQQAYPGKLLTEVPSVNWTCMWQPQWRRYESTDVPTWAKLPQPTWEHAQSLERRTHPRDQGSNFVEFHMYTDEELEDHRRLGLRPYWSFLKGSFFAYEPAPADGGVGICWEKEVQTWTLPTLLGIYGHQFSLKQLWYAWENLPIAVKRHSRGQRGGGAQKAQDRIVERKKIQRETMDFLSQMQLPKPTSVEEWRLIWREVGTLLAAKHFISHTPVPVMDLPVADVVDSKEQLRFRAMCDERISFPFEELRPFEEVYAKLEPYVQSSSYVEVKVAWRCNTEQWWWAEVDPAHAGPLYRKLNYSDEAIRAFGLDPDLPVGAPALGAAAVGADSSTKTPLLMEYPDQPRPPITVENVNSVMGKDSKKK
eukprot:symbB.v1.2.002939.t1/scaffold163.1/size290254/1